MRALSPESGIRVDFDQAASPGRRQDGLPHDRRTIMLLQKLAAAAAVALSFLAAAPSASAALSAKEKEQARAEVQKTARETLDRLYRTQPGAKAAIANSAGYAVFSNFGMKIFFAGGGKGEGVAVDNKTKKVTYMKMVEAQAGLGMSAKKFRLVWVFENQKNFSNFVNSGYEFGGQASAAAKKGSQGAAYAGAVSVSPGVWLYQLTDEGLAAEITAKGTKYYKDGELN
jgi:lipid-binding SYLF domain-containing protein